MTDDEIRAIIAKLEQHNAALVVCIGERYRHIDALKSEIAGYEVLIEQNRGNLHDWYSSL